MKEQLNIIIIFQVEEMQLRKIILQNVIQYLLKRKEVKG